MKRTPPDILTIDVEEWFHGHNYLEHVPPGSWEIQDRRVEANTERCLELLARHAVTGTFFVLGWTAERHPDIVRRIAAAGHEIACHSMGHPIVFRLTPQEFRDDLKRCREVLAAAGVDNVAGYRAPSFTITPPVHDYLHILREEGFTYDCSLFPVHHPRYGQPASPRHPFLLAPPDEDPCPERDPLLVLPMTTARILGVNVPFAGGGYMRLLPGWAYGMLRRIALRQGQSVVTYLHPWELDDHKPVTTQSKAMRWRSQSGQETVMEKLDGVLAQGSFRTMGDYAAGLRVDGLRSMALPLV